MWQFGLGVADLVQNVLRLESENGEIVLRPTFCFTCTKLGLVLQTLEYEAELLLSAQGHYLRAIKVGNGYWATAAGERIGSLYEVLHKQMMESPVPKELSAEEGEVYRQEVRRRIRILLTKLLQCILDFLNRLTGVLYIDLIKSLLEI